METFVRLLSSGDTDHDICSAHSAFLFQMYSYFYSLEHHKWYRDEYLKAFKCCLTTKTLLPALLRLWLTGIAVKWAKSPCTMAH